MWSDFLLRIYSFFEKIGMRFEPSPCVDPDILEFHSDQVELEEQKLPPALRSMLYVILAVIVIGISWSIIAKVDRVVVAEGSLTSSAQTIKLQPLENSIIKNFRVKVGDVVQQGQTLVDLDPTFSLADATRLKQRGETLSLHMRRLEAELEPDRQFDVSTEADPVEERVQRNLFEGRKKEFKFRIEVYENTIKELRASQASLESQLVESDKQLVILTKIENIYRDLYNKKHESLATYLNSQYQKAQKTSDIARLKNDIEEKKQALLKAEADMNAFSSKWMNDILTELTEVRHEYDGLREELLKASKLYDL